MWVKWIFYSHFSILLIYKPSKVHFVYRKLYVLFLESKLFFQNYRSVYIHTLVKKSIKQDLALNIYQVLFHKPSRMSRCRFSTPCELLHRFVNMFLNFRQLTIFGLYDISKEGYTILSFGASILNLSMNITKLILVLQCSQEGNSIYNSLAFFKQPTSISNL